MNNNPTVLVGICGGIAVYKAADVVSHLVQRDYDVRVCMTPAAQRFVTPVTFASLSRHRVLTDIFPPDGAVDGEDLFPHLYPAAHADLMVLLPATADILAKIAAGMADDIVSAAALGLPPAAHRVFCPAMNSTMWSQPVVQRNVHALVAEGWTRIGPATGVLACGTSGEGRMSEPQEIVSTIETVLARGRDWAGRKVLILSGPTREPLDPVRFLGNASSGRMGQALAEEAAHRGAEVLFVTGPVDPVRWPQASRVHRIPVQTADEMLEAALAHREGADLEIFAAAVSDYAPTGACAEKTPKETEPDPLPLKATPDIAARLGADRPAGCRAVGFALETRDGPARARRKLEAKRFDAIVLNGAESMGADSASFSLLTSDGASEDWGRLDKATCARRLLDWVAIQAGLRNRGDGP